MDKKHFFYLIGMPGTGKTTLIRSVLEGIPYMQCKDGLVSYIRYPAGAELGVIRGGGFSGTDGLAMDVMPHAIGWLWQSSFKYLLAEGDRLASDKFFRSVQSAGYKLTVALLDLPLADVLERGKARGSNQDKQWLKGRVTKVGKLISKWVDPLWILDANNDIPWNRGTLMAHPVFKAIAGVKLEREASSGYTKV